DPLRPPAASFSSPSALTARARQMASSSATWRRIVSSWSRTCASALSPSYAKLTLQGLETLLQHGIHLALTQGARRIAERAVPGYAAVPLRDPGPAILVKHLEPLEQAPRGPPQDVGHLGRADAWREQKREVALNGRLRRQRPVGDDPALGQRQPHLEAEQGRRPHGGVGLRSEEHTSELQSRSDLVCR